MSQRYLEPTIEDSFGVMRTKVTDITRSMQQFHIQQLQQEKQVEALDIQSIDDRPLSPLSILCPTTNALIQTRVLEEANGSCADQNDEIWRKKFLHLMSSVITYSENLESISTDLLGTEGKVREFLMLQDDIQEELDQQEKSIQEQLDECNRISRQQSDLIESLIEIDHDLDTKSTTQASYSHKQRKRRSFMTNTTLSTMSNWQSSEHSQGRGVRDQSCSASSFTTVDSQFLQDDLQQQEIDSLVPISTMEDVVHKLRWEIGTRFGGGIGTGHVIHSFEGPLSGIELIIAGSGTIATTLNETIQESHTQSSSIQHIRFHRHNYMLHINHQDRKTRFKLLPKHQWIKDEDADTCQFLTCQTKFTLIQRRHHCRRCGFVICQRHGLNRLPLFSTAEPNNTNKWHRVCDTCFHQLIIITRKKRS